MAVMARQLGIPARVAVGFLTPDEIADGVYEYSSDDLHAWPELFIAGSGWVPFEPTPSDRTGAVPSYTRDAVDLQQPGVDGPSGRADEQLPDRNGQPSTAADPEEQDPEADGATGTGGRRCAVGPWSWPRSWSCSLVVVLALTPRAVRRRRREHRLGAGPEGVWDELRDTARDLGLRYVDHRSPRETAAALATGPLTTLRPRTAGSEPPCSGSRPLSSGCATQPPEPAGRPTPVPTPAGRTTAALVVQTLGDGATPRARRRATWLPRTLLRPTRRTSVPAQPETEALELPRRGRRPRALSTGQLVNR